MAVHPDPQPLRPAFSWRRLLRQRLPIIGWLSTYTRGAAVADAIAGTTAGLTMIAQAIAYAALAELPAQYGLYSAFAGSLIYCVLGTIEAVSIGPTSLNALLTLQYTVGRPVEYVIVLAFITGCVQASMAVLQLGFIVDFISVPVTSAFMTATVIIIAMSQLKNFMGVAFSSSRFVDTFAELWGRAAQAHAGDLWLSLACCGFLVAVRALQAVRWRRPAVARFVWYFGILSNGVMVLAAASVAYWFASRDAGVVPFRLSGRVTPGLPPVQLPPFQFEHADETYTFARIVGDLGAGCVVVPLIALLSNVAIGKALAAGRTVDAAQEMWTLGVCNIVGSMVSAMPTGGAFSRSAVIRASGVRTPLHGAYSAAVIVLSLTLLTPYFYYIPRAALAAVLVVSVVFMIDFRLPVRLWRSHRADFWSYALTFTVCLGVGVEWGLTLGVAYTLGRLVYMWARPSVTRTVRYVAAGGDEGDAAPGRPYIEVDARTGLFYTSADWLRERTMRTARAHGGAVPVVLRCERFAGLDYTSAQALRGIAKDLEQLGDGSGDGGDGGGAPLVLLGLAPELRAGVEGAANVVCVASVDELGEVLAGCRADRIDGSSAITMPAADEQVAGTARSIPMTDVVVK